MRVDKTLSRSPRLVRATSRLNSVRPSLQTEGGRRDLGVLRGLGGPEQDHQSGEGHHMG